MINNIIPLDDLNWQENEKKFVALSNEEYEKVLLACHDSKMDMQDIDAVMKVIRWAEFVKIGSIMLNRLMAGALTVKTTPESAEPLFCVRKEEKDKHE